MAAPPSVSGHGGRELPPAGGKKKKKKKRKTPPQGEGAPAQPDEREAAEVGSVRQWAIDSRGVVTGHVSEEDARASLLELAVNVAAVVRHPDGYYSEDDLHYLPGQHFYLLKHFLRVQAGGLYGDDGLYDGRYEHILRDHGANAPREVLDAMGRVTVGSLDFDIAALDEALQTIYDPRVSAP